MAWEDGNGGKLVMCLANHARSVGHGHGQPFECFQSYKFCKIEQLSTVNSKNNTVTKPD